MNTTVKPIAGSARTEDRPPRRVYDNVADLVGDPDNPTPMVRLSERFDPQGQFNLFIKLERNNPFGSIKDRTALYLLRGTPIREDQVLTEPTAGNTGIALAALADEGISAEVIDPRWLDEASFPRAAVLESVGRTGAIVIAEDAQHTLSMGPRILDYLQPDLHASLRTAPLRVTGLDAYSPVSKPLEAYVHIQDHDIRAAIVAAAGKDDA